MTPDTLRLERECRTFTRLLTGSPATPYVIGKYLDAHRVRPDFGVSAGFEHALVGAAASSPVVAQLADAYARLLMPRGALRKKLVLLLAILETSRDFHRTIDAPPRPSPSRALFSLAASGVIGTLVMLSGMLIFGTLRLLTRSETRPS